MKTIIKNGLIIDGTGSKGFMGDVLVEDKNIACIAPAITGGFDREIDAKDRVVCPGFIDTHSHSDLAALLAPVVLPKLHQGITTEVLGQDGISMAPLSEKYVRDWRLNIGGLEGDSDEVEWAGLQSTGEYLHLLRKAKPCTNFAYLAPHGNIRLQVMGFSNLSASDAQISQMESLLRREFEEGAIGLSTGLVYVPCVYAQTEELVRLCKVAREYDAPFVVHQRYESGRILHSMQELGEIARRSGVHLHISHFKITGKRNADLRFEVFELIEKFKKEGIEFTADQYPYIAGSTMLGRVIPPWAHVGGGSELLKRLRDPIAREDIKRDILHTETAWDNMIDVCTEGGIIVTSVTRPENERFVGHSIVEVGKMWGKTPLDAAMDLLLIEENKVGMICKNGVEETMRDILTRTDVNVCTDGLLGGTPHPRVYGAFPRFIGKYVRDEGLLPLETGIYKMTKLAADSFRIKNRGVLKEGAKADIVVFDAKTIIDVGDYVNPRQYAKGIDTVMVNGKIVLQGGDVNASAASGEVINTPR